MVAYVKVKKKISIEMEKLVSVLQCFNIAQHQQHSMLQVSSSVVDVELRHIIMNVMSYGVRFRCAVQQD